MSASLNYKLLFVIIMFTAFSTFGNIDNISKENSLKVNVATSNYYLKSAQNQKAYIAIELTAPPIDNSQKRLPLNLALALDQSLLVSNSNREIIISAILNTITQLQKNDTLSIISYCNTVQTVFPAGRVADYKFLTKSVRNIETGSGSSLFSAISKAAFEVRKFTSQNAVNRIIIVSSGEITMGPDSPEEMQDIGLALAKENITVTSIGVGYSFSEKALYTLSQSSRGNYYYAETIEQLPQALSKDISKALTVTAMDININIKTSDHLRSVKTLSKSLSNNDSEIFIKELYSNIPFTIAIEAEVTPGQSTKIIDMCNIEINYNNILNNQSERILKQQKAIYTNNELIIENNINKKVMSLVSELFIINKYKSILKLRDSRNISMAVLAAQEANSSLSKYCNLYQAKKLDQLAEKLSKIPDILQEDRLYFNGGRKNLSSIIYAAQ